MTSPRVCALEVEGSFRLDTKPESSKHGGKEGAIMHSNTNATLVHNLKYVSLLASLAALFLLCAARV